MDKEYANGLWGNPPRDGAPDYVVGSLSIIPERFTEWLNAQETNDKGYVRLDVMTRKDGNGWSFPLNTWKPGGAQRKPAQSASTEPDWAKTDVASTEEQDNIPF